MRYDQIDCFNHNSFNTSPFWMIYGLFSSENLCRLRVRVAWVWVQVQPAIPAGYPCHSLVVKDLIILNRSYQIIKRVWIYLQIWAEYFRMVIFVVIKQEMQKSCQLVDLSSVMKVPLWIKLCHCINIALSRCRLIITARWERRGWEAMRVWWTTCRWIRIWAIWAIQVFIWVQAHVPAWASKFMIMLTKKAWWCTLAVCCCSEWVSIGVWKWSLLICGTYHIMSWTCDLNLKLWLNAEASHIPIWKWNFHLNHSWILYSEQP